MNKRAFSWSAASHSNLPSRNVVVTVYRDNLKAGVIVNHPGSGWKYMPYYQAQNSRRLWPSPSKAVEGRLPREAILAVREVSP